MKKRFTKSFLPVVSEETLLETSKELYGKKTKESVLNKMEVFVQKLKTENTQLGHFFYELINSVDEKSHIGDFSACLVYVLYNSLEKENIKNKKDILSLIKEDVEELKSFYVSCFSKVELFDTEEKIRNNLNECLGKFVKIIFNKIFYSITE